MRLKAQAAAVQKTIPAVSADVPVLNVVKILPADHAAVAPSFHVVALGLAAAASKFLAFVA